MLQEVMANAALHDMHLLKLMGVHEQEPMPPHGVGPWP